MIAHIDKVIRHLRAQIETADKMDSEFVYITRREAEACLELAEAQDVIQETFADQEKIRAARGYPTNDEVIAVLARIEQYGGRWGTAAYHAIKRLQDQDRLIKEARYKGYKDGWTVGRAFRQIARKDERKG